MLIALPGWFFPHNAHCSLLHFLQVFTLMLSLQAYLTALLFFKHFILEVFKHTHKYRGNITTILTLFLTKWFVNIQYLSHVQMSPVVSKMTFYHLFFSSQYPNMAVLCIRLIGPPKLHLQPFPPLPAFRILLLGLVFFHNTHHIVTYYVFYLLFLKNNLSTTLKCQIPECQDF